MSTPHADLARFIRETTEKALGPYQRVPLPPEEREKIRREAFAAREAEWPVGEERDGYRMVSRKPLTAADDTGEDVAVCSEQAIGPLSLETIHLTFNLTETTDR